MYWAGTTLVQMGLEFSTIALAWFVLQTTGSAVRIAVVLAVVPIARIATSAGLGRLLDRWPRRRLMVADNLGQMVLYGLIPVLAWTHRLTFPELVAMVAVAAALSPMSMIGRGVLLPLLVEDAELEDANSLSQVRMSLVTLAGPALGGVLVGFVGAPWTLTVTASCYGLYAVSLMLIPAEKFGDWAHGQPGKVRPGTWRVFREVPLLVVLMAATLFFNLTYGPLEPALPVLVARVFHAGPGVLGMIWSAFAVGALMGTALWVRFSPTLSPRAIVTGIIVGWGLFSGALGLTSHPWQAMVWMALGGLVYAPYNIVAATWQQRLIPAPNRGSAFGLMQSVTSAGLPTGQLVGGILVSGLGAPLTILLGGAATLALGAVMGFLPGIWSAGKMRNVSAG